MVSKPPQGSGEQPSSTSLLFDRLVDDERTLTHEERIQQLIVAALPDPEQRLKLEGELARGGMGAVRLAFDSALQRRMAAKTMHASTYEHVMLVHGFLREAQVTGQLDHPNIVPIHELGRDAKGELYFTMKLVEGQSLKVLIGGAPIADVDRLFNLLEIFVKICDALGFAHSRGVLHCDIKSANVMVGEFGQVYLMDWGGAQLLPRLPARAGVDTRKWVHDSLPPLPEADTKGLVFGTPSYMSPEQASAGRDPLDERSDIFSMGALLYEIMTGRPPYRGSSALEGIMMAQICDIRAPDELPEIAPNTFPTELVRIVMKALAKRPDDRFRSVAEMKLAILRLMRGGGNFATVRVARGAHVVRQGEVGDAAYIVVSGKLEVYKVIEGERVVLRQLGAGDMFGETAIFAASPRTASVVVTADASMVVVTSEVIEQELDSMKPWMGAFIRTLATRFGGIDEERRARSHSGPSVSAVGPTGPDMDSPADTSARFSPLNQRPQRPAPTPPLTVTPAPPLAATPAPPLAATPAPPVTAAVFQDRSDITRVADLGSVVLPEVRREAPRTAAGTIGEPVLGESVMIDLSDDDETAAGPTSDPSQATIIEATGEAADDDADTRLIAEKKKPPARG